MWMLANVAETDSPAFHVVVDEVEHQALDVAVENNANHASFAINNG